MRSDVLLILFLLPNSANGAQRRESRRMYDQPRMRRVRFYHTDTGRKVAREEYFELPEAGRAALHELFTRYEHGQERRGEVEPVGNGLFEFRVRVANNRFRAYFFQDGPKYVIVVLCTHKKRPKMDNDDKALALRRMRDWKRRGVA